MILPILATAGSALVLTQSSITAPLRDMLDRAVLQDDAEPKRNAWVMLTIRVAAKLTSCPMCAGFWLGLAWAAWLGSRGAVLFALGFAGSLSSATIVALWLVFSEAHSALGLWRYLKTPPSGVHAARWEMAKRMRTDPLAIRCPEPDCETVGGCRCKNV